MDSEVNQGSGDEGFKAAESDFFEMFLAIIARKPREGQVREAAYGVVVAWKQI